eukprot:5829263-Amphidinium_carterae.2
MQPNNFPAFTRLVTGVTRPSLNRQEDALTSQDVFAWHLLLPDFPGLVRDIESDGHVDKQHQLPSIEHNSTRCTQEC